MSDTFGTIASEVPGPAGAIHRHNEVTEKVRPLLAPYPTDLYPGCPCGDCLTKVNGAWRMWLCPKCGNKRCPGAIHHDRHEP